MVLYIKFDRVETEELSRFRVTSFVETYRIFSEIFNLVSPKFSTFQDLPLFTLNKDMQYTKLPPSEATKGLLEIFEKYKEPAKLGLEIITSMEFLGKPVWLSFVLYPELTSRREIPDIAISIYSSSSISEIEEIFTTENKEKLLNAIKKYHELKVPRLKYRKVKLTQQDSISHPQHDFAYYSTATEHVVDMIRYARENPSLKRKFDLINETKIGSMIYQNKNTHEIISKLYQDFNIGVQPGSLYIIPKKSADAMEFYQSFERRILRPLSDILPTRQKTLHALNNIDLKAFSDNS